MDSYVYYKETDQYVSVEQLDGSACGYAWLLEDVCTLMIGSFLEGVCTLIIGSFLEGVCTIIIGSFLEGVVYI